MPKFVDDVHIAGAATISAAADVPTQVLRAAAGQTVPLQNFEDSSGNVLLSILGYAGHPTTGTWVTGQAILDSAGAVWTCTVGGTPGTWVGAGGAGQAAWTISTVVHGTHLTPVSGANTWVLCDTTAGSTLVNASATPVAGETIRMTCVAGANVMAFDAYTFIGAGNGAVTGNAVDQTLEFMYDATAAAYVQTSGFASLGGDGQGFVGARVATLDSSGVPRVYLDDGQGNIIPLGLGLNVGRVSGPLVAGTIASRPPASGTIQTALGNLSAGTAFHNTLSYDVWLTVYLAVTANTSLVVADGVGATNTPTQTTVITGTVATGIVPIRVKIPSLYYRLLTISGTVTDAIVGQYLEAS